MGSSGLVCVQGLATAWGGCGGVNLLNFCQVVSASRAHLTPQVPWAPYPQVSHLVWCLWGVGVSGSPM